MTASFLSSLPATVGWRQDLAQPGAPACSHRFDPRACITSPPELCFLLPQTGSEPPSSRQAALALPPPLVPTCSTSPLHAHTQQLPSSQQHLPPQHPVSWVLPDTPWLWKNLAQLRTEGSGQFWVSSVLFTSTRQA